MDVDEPSLSNSTQVVFRCSDGKEVRATPGLSRLSLMLVDLANLGFACSSEPIDLPRVHSQVLDQINSLVEKIMGNEELQAQIPFAKINDERWNEFTIKNLHLFEDWLSHLTTDMLIRVANAAQFMQIKAVVHPVLAVLAEKTKSTNLDALRRLLNETDEMDDDMRAQYEKIRHTHPHM